MYLGLDLGTSGLKALVVDAHGDLVATAHASYDVLIPHAGWSEQDPETWVTACRAVFGDLPRAVRSEINAISLSGHMHGAVAVDKAGSALRPCILWNDMRAANQAAKLDDTAGVRDLSGNIVFPGFTAPKLAWMAAEEPDLFSQVHKVLLPKDFVLHWLTGRFVTDCSDAAGTSWLDVGARAWSDDLLRAGGMRADQMPDLVEGCDVVGAMRDPLIAEFDFAPTVKIVAGGADNAVAACGVGAVREGQGFVSLGTSGVLLAGKNRYAPAPETAVHTFCHAVPNQWYQMGVMLSATGSLNWLAEILGKSPKDVAALCDGPISGPSSLTFLPYLTGERTPHNDANIGGAFIGLRAEHTPRDMAQAVMEGVSYGLRDCLEALKSTGTQLDEILAIGGGSNSAFWLDTLATVLNLNLALPEKGDFGAALGAARLAMIGDGMDADTVLVPPRIEKTIAPNRDLVGAYEEGYQKYTRLYPLLRDLG